MEKIKLTAEGVEKLRAEYRYLLDVVRPEVTRELVEARSLGDLSENAEYDAARERQGKVESRVLEIEAILSNYELIKANGTSKKVGIGSFVTIKDLTLDLTEEYEIVGNVEADPLAHRISSESPLAKAVIGAKAGDIVEVEAPVPYKVEIIKLGKK